MKIKKYICALLLGALGLVSCSKDEDPQQADKSRVAGTLALDLSGAFDGMKSLTLDMDQDMPPFTHQEGVTDWTTHCFIRNATGSSQYYAEVKWKVTNSTTRSIKLESDTHVITLQTISGESTVLPQNGETWYIAGIAGGGTLSPDRKSVTFAPRSWLNMDTRTSNEMSIPIAFGWTEFKVDEAGTAPKVQVTFKPQGSLLRLKLDNTKQKNGGYFNVIERMEFKSNAITQDGSFDYSLSGAPRATYTSIPRFVYTDPLGTEEDFSMDISIKRGQVGNYLLWAMPREAQPATGYRTSLKVGPYRLYHPGLPTTRTRIADRTKPYRSSYAYAHNIDVDHPIIPLKYLAEYHVSSVADNQFATAHHGRVACAYYTYVDAKTKFAGNITMNDGKEYRLPTATEMRAIAGGGTTNDAGIYVPLVRREFKANEPTLAGYGEHSPSTYGLYSINPADEIAYAMTLVNSADKAKSPLRIVYRYTIKHYDRSVDADELRYMEITSRYVGPGDDADLNLDNTSGVSAWAALFDQADLVAKGEYETRIIPYSGWLRREDPYNYFPRDYSMYGLTRTSTDGVPTDLTQTGEYEGTKGSMVFYVSRLIPNPGTGLLDTDIGVGPDFINRRFPIRLFRTSVEDL